MCRGKTSNPGQRRRPRRRRRHPDDGGDEAGFNTVLLPCALMDCRSAVATAVARGKKPPPPPYFSVQLLLISWAFFLLRCFLAPLHLQPMKHRQHLLHPMKHRQHLLRLQKIPRLLCCVTQCLPLWGLQMLLQAPSPAESERAALGTPASLHSPLYFWFAIRFFCDF